ncbi:hypothetical protein STRMA_1800 [Streptococcus macacae NCTC 11558]|uniref:Uncharacterized protein n=1 Tax=Streptococcus macacae NCTC 11558 TaxID=764298 RepID=G5JV89_9STRE|nr:hypothetical protein STRMA_1800 [Streptococcus macacae NCTC 11558]
MNCTRIQIMNQFDRKDTANPLFQTVFQTFENTSHTWQTL